MPPSIDEDLLQTNKPIRPVIAIGSVASDIYQPEVAPVADQAGFFLGASQELRRLFDKAFVSQDLKAGETLFEQDQFDDRLYVLDAGLLEVSVYSAAGRKLSLNLLRPESVFGEIAMFDPGPRTARIEAVEDCKLRYIRQTALIAEIAREPHLAAELLGLAGKRMRWMSRQMEEQVFLPPAARLAAKVLYLSGADGRIVMSQAQIADYVGVTREVVSKVLSEWRREGYVALSRGKIEIRDVEALENIKKADFL
ncbi:Crp/Fnr family transcriptional regulator [Sulfitobacter sp. F26204]|uniref:Crp/Fnr family transcriptional regulator n=1 Tax=Sulfitobacter sp. F26204 TaxID=2996014 RepID=UPI00225DF68D|nr:Crp/Fnr family transcriptional regulator [Sulfitobacter sp. F26204]MCX7559236.1 Crp/Fnr family transcriptional regulator [Sulfitobacter sp. F26204]